MTRSITQGDTADLRDFAVEAARRLHDRHCEDVRLLDVRGLSQVCDYVLIGTGTSDRQMKSVSAELEDLGAERGHPCFRSSRDSASTWIVTDFVDLVAHVFEPTQRAYYDLEALWSDAAEVSWRRDGEEAGENGAPEETAAGKGRARGAEVSGRPAGEDPARDEDA